MPFFLTWQNFSISLACCVTRALCVRSGAGMEGKANLPLSKRTEKCVFPKSDGIETRFSSLTLS